MNEHKFSNQKSALEDYFESLLSDIGDEAKPEILKQEQKVASPKSTDASTEKLAAADADNVSADESAAVSESVIEEPSIEERIPEKTIPEESKRTSVADMLATVEEKVSETPVQTVPEFAEPAAEISIPLPEVAPVVETETVVEAEVVEQVVVEVEEVINEVVEPEIAQAPVVEAVKSKQLIPEWAEAPFQCLLFKVGDLSLAVPLVRLNGVIPWSDKVVETPNQTDWYLGVLMNHGHKVQVIDTAVMVLPPEHRQEMSDDPADRLSHILLVDDQRWGLACDSIGDVVWLKNTDVKWRSNKTKRPWLLGTAIDHMCAVMDTEAFADMLEGSK